MRKIILSALIMIIVLGTATIVYGLSQYTDITETNWAYDAVTAMADKEVIKGYPDGSFKPKNTITYGEFIKMSLVAATGEDVKNASKPNHWSLNYYNKALELKYFNIYDIDKSQLNNLITRGDMALIISAILGDVKIDKYDEIQQGIKDVTYQTEYEYDITKAYATGILTGYTDNTFRPENTLSRAESATVIYRLVDESKRELPGVIKEVKGETGNVEDVVKNSDSFVNPGNGTINEDLAAATTYEIVTDASKYGMSLHENRGTTWIQIDNTTGLHQMFLMRNGNIVETMQLIPDTDGSRVAIYDSNIAQIDYIVSVNTIEHTMILIMNPF